MSEIRLEPLDRYDAWHLVTEAAAAEGIARVVWSSADGPRIVPLNFTVAAGALWFQVDADSRLARECRGQRVVVEVDHVQAATHTGWSVIVTGEATTMPAAEDPGLLEHLQVWPQGVRQELVRVGADEVTGRRLRQRA